MKNFSKHYQKRIAELKAEVEVQNRRINLRDEDVGKLHCENARLKAENERLQKAGDAMHVALLRLTSGTPNWDGKVYWDWNAAKDGKPTE